MASDDIPPPPLLRHARKLRIALLAGTRPEAIKLAPLVLAWRGSADVTCVLIHTGQHDALFHQALAPFGIVPDETLALDRDGGAPDDMAARIRALLPPVLAALAPDMAIVQGDTTSAWAAALTANAMEIPLAHVEAGLRTGDPALPWPEERNRVEIDAIADLLLAPTRRAAANLRRERVGGHVHVTGNTGIDALLHVRARVAPAVRDDGRRHIIVTAHRRENVGAGIDRICAALRMLVADRFDRAVTVHLHTNPAGARMQAALHDVPHITLSPPVAFTEMVAALAGADLVLSDSGGLQEECAALGVPLLILRANTERPEAIERGNALLVGTDPDEIVRAANRLLDDRAAHLAMSRPSDAFGDGHAARRITELVETFPFARA